MLSNAAQQVVRNSSASAGKTACLIPGQSSARKLWQHLAEFVASQLAITEVATGTGGISGIEPSIKPDTMNPPTVNTTVAS
mmetsp:Transcript_75927/g.150162  ORF Transcript_75927/g.150162 Transcript_75927/m.150162 type:complete len:81 (-) Transcript_75927:7-249(-)